MFDPDSLVIQFLGISIWHHDPCKDGTDDSCGYFKRARHGKKEILEKIVSHFDFDWDRTFTSDSGQTYKCGLFGPEGDLVLSPMGITLNLFWMAAFEYFNHNWNKSKKFCARNVFDILHFAENPTDSLYDSIIQKFGSEKREERIRSMAVCIYGYILRKDQKWFDHPRFHFWHYRISVNWFHKKYSGVANARQ